MNPSALSELRSGVVGTRFATLLYETVDAIRRLRGFPPPKGYERWDEQAVAEVAHDFLTSPQAKERLIAIALRAGDESSLERVLEATVVNFLRSRFRQSERGRMLRALRRILEGDEQFVAIGSGSGGEGWALRETQSRPPYNDSVRTLLDAAYSVSGVQLARWRSDAKNRAPIAERSSLTAVLSAVLSAAQGPLSMNTLLDVIAARFPNNDDPKTVPIEDDAVLTDGGLATAEVRSSQEVIELANFIWLQLSENERLVAGLLAQPVRDVAANTGLSRGSAHRAMISAREVIAELLDSDDEPLDVVARLRDLSAIARNRGTESGGLASSNGEEP